MSDAPEAILDQVLGRNSSHHLVIHSDKVSGQAREPAVDQDVRYLLLLDAAETLHRPLRRGDDQRVHPPGEQLLDLLPLEFGILFRGRDHQAVPLLAQYRREALGEFGKKGMDQVRNDEADAIGPAGHQRPGGEVGPVLQLLHPLEYLLAGLVADARGVAEYLRNGDDANANVPSDIFHGDRHNSLREPGTRNLVKR